MSSLEVEIADIERELLALSGNQPPNPAQIKTYAVTRTSTVSNEVKTISFVDGSPRFTQVFASTLSTSLVNIYLQSGQLKVIAYGSAGKQYTVTSLGEFSLV